MNLRKQQKLKLNYPEKLTIVERSEFPNTGGKLPDLAYVSRKFLVQVFFEGTPEYPTLVRLSVNRVKRNQHGWAEGITWEELQGIKREIGYAEWYGMELYPPDEKIVNVANLRHLWLLEKPLGIGWGMK